MDLYPHKLQAEAEIRSLSQSGVHALRLHSRHPRGAGAGEECPARTAGAAETEAARFGSTSRSRCGAGSPASGGRRRVSSREADSGYFRNEQGSAKTETEAR